MEDRETPRMHKYGKSKTTRIMMAHVRHVTTWAGSTKYQAAWFLLNRVYMDGRQSLQRKDSVIVRSVAAVTESNCNSLLGCKKSSR